ncbi:TatD family hydrolase [Desertibacillus haloalkaliphilus]|uniref:TatD family hydrolase n=1 Tax=Desertibacillus haloalkaliphilus TaxID=1328930 RepID=UPI001C26F758|nr:TatD family hydrolase [Desertibacillus haloalkaliphilus]MBU8904982.1 TatD family hydrolase [Desertibacillus haloalkaliphilus]
MIDAHLHLDKYPHDQLELMIDHWQDAGITQVVAVSTDLASSYRTLRLKQEFPNFIIAAIGYHPEQQPPTDHELNEIFSLLNNERDLIDAIGEIGLPHYSIAELNEREWQKHLNVFSEFLQQAKQQQLPVAIHAVHDKAKRALAVLQHHKIKAAHFHWLKADADTLTKMIEAGYFISVTPEVVYRERDQQLASRVPLDQLLIETDGPWRFNGPFEGKATTPLFLWDVIHKLAEVKELSVSEVQLQLTANTIHFYRKEA